MGPRAATPTSWEDEYDAEVAAEKAAAEKAAGGQPPPDATLASRVPRSSLLRQTESGGHPCAWSTAQLVA